MTTSVDEFDDSCQRLNCGVSACRADAPITAHMWENALCDDMNVCG